MKKNIISLFSCILALCMFSGCAHFSSNMAKNGKPVQIKKAGEGLVRAFVRNDAEAFLKLLPKSVADEFGKNGFKKTMDGMKEQVGTPVSYEFVLNLEHPKFVVSVWKIRYKRKSSDFKKDIFQETLFRAISGTVNGKEILLGFNFF